MILEAVRYAPGGQRVGERLLRQISRPGRVSVGPSQRRGSSDRTEFRELPRTNVLSIDQLKAIRPWSDVDARAAIAWRSAW